MKIIIDAMGGDLAPQEPLKGAAQAVQELGVEVIAVGDVDKMQAVMREEAISAEGIELVHASEVIGMDEEATDVLKKRPDSSLAVACRLLKEQRGEALVSAGSTGALLVGGTLLVGRIKGIKRPAIATVLPGLEKPWLLVDCGANAECRAEMLVQFAAMGAAYQERVMGVENPGVALANNGSEETKGTALQLEAYSMLKASGLNFMGNIEGRDIPYGKADVVVCDGFTGNIILKVVEGLAKVFSSMMKDMFYKNAKTKVAGAMLKPELAEFKKKFDYKEYGGAPLLGIQYPVLKAHGSSDAKAIKNAIRQAKNCVESKVSEAIEQHLAAQKEKAE